MINCLPSIACRTLLLVLPLLVAAPQEAIAQRFPFDRTVPVAPDAILVVQTDRGAVTVQRGTDGAIAIAGTVTVRVGFGVPANAVALAQQVAAAPPITADARTVTLTTPASAEARRAVTVSYVVRVPETMRVDVVTRSGAIALDDVDGATRLSTRSGRITASDVGALTVTSGSGAVRVDRARGPVSVTTSSSAIDIVDAGTDVRVLSGSGSVDVGLIGGASVDVETRSSAIDVTGAGRSLTVRSGSGAVAVAGTPSDPWHVETQSGRITVRVPPTAPMHIDARSRSGSIHADDIDRAGSARGQLTADVGTGGPTVRLVSRSAAIDIERE